MTLLYYASLTLPRSSPFHPLASHHFHTKAIWKKKHPFTNHSDWDWLVVLAILKNTSSPIGKDYPQYIMENKSHVPNHQPDRQWLRSSGLARILEHLNGHFLKWIQRLTRKVSDCGLVGKMGNPKVDGSWFFHWNSHTLGVQISLKYITIMKPAIIIYWNISIFLAINWRYIPISTTLPLALSKLDPTRTPAGIPNPWHPWMDFPGWQIECWSKTPWAFFCVIFH